MWGLVCYRTRRTLEEFSAGHPLDTRPRYDNSELFPDVETRTSQCHVEPGEFSEITPETCLRHVLEHQKNQKIWSDPSHLQAAFPMDFPLLPSGFPQPFAEDPADCLRTGWLLAHPDKIDWGEGSSRKHGNHGSIIMISPLVI